MTSFTVSTTIKSDLFHAWEFYFNQINSWWPKEFYTSPKTKRFIIDTFLGGKAYEDHGEGGGLVWGDVIGVDYPNSLQMRGNLTKEFGGPVMTFERINFDKTPTGTKVTYSIEFIGQINERSAKMLQERWKDLLQNRFTKYSNQRD